MLRKNYIPGLSFLVLLFFFLPCCSYKKDTTKEEWQSLFNGKDLAGWNIKIKGEPLNNNYKNTFRVEDSMIRVVYNDYDKFDNHFGHLYTQLPYSYYRIRLQYRFVGNHLADAPVWADRNSGIMLHSQSASSVELNQDFPVSLEMQFLCGNGKDERTTGNICTPGTQIHINNTLITDHCLNAGSKTYLLNDWVTGEAEVYGDSLIRHIINSDTVLTYTKTIIGGGFVSPEHSWSRANILDSMVWINKANTPLREGYIALQAESQPVDFRRIEILNLAGCMDPKAKNYKSYFIKADNSKCKY